MWWSLSGSRACSSAVRVMPGITSMVPLARVASCTAVHMAVPRKGSAILKYALSWCQLVPLPCRAGLRKTWSRCSTTGSPISCGIAFSTFGAKGKAQEEIALVVERADLEILLDGGVRLTVAFSRDIAEGPGVAQALQFRADRQNFAAAEKFRHRHIAGILKLPHRRRSQGHGFLL